MNPFRSLVAPLAVGILAVVLAMPGAPGSAAPSYGNGERPHVLLVTVDTLRTDHLSAFGYHRPTSPAIDALLASGVSFSDARTIEPLTAPALVSMITGIDPHEHGATRNGLRPQSGLPSFVKLLRRAGWHASAVVGNWTLRDELSGLGEHFHDYEAFLDRARWFGLVRREATGADLTDRALEVLDDLLESGDGKPVLLWVHYVDPHAPYRARDEYRDRLGLPPEGPLGKIARYDTEIAAVDDAVGRLVAGARRRLGADRTLVVFAADHGESLGEHGYWGHGRDLHEVNLSIALGFSWPGRFAPAVSGEPALITDVAPTLLELAGAPIPHTFKGQSLLAALRGGTLPPRGPLCFQAHRGAVNVKHESERARTHGLLAIGVIVDDHKEIVRVRPGRQRKLYDLAADPLELRSTVAEDSPASADLRACADRIEQGLIAVDGLPVDQLDDESLEELRALGYLD